MLRSLNESTPLLSFSLNSIPVMFPCVSSPGINLPTFTISSQPSPQQSITSLHHVPSQTPRPTCSPLITRTQLPVRVQSTSTAQESLSN